MSFVREFFNRLDYFTLLLWLDWRLDHGDFQRRCLPRLTFLGVAIPCIVLEILGMALTTAFTGGLGIGDLLTAAAKPLGGFGTLLLVLLALSIVANNIPNDYSLGLSMQVLGKPFQRINRAVWALIASVIYVLIAEAAATNFNQTLSNFLLLIAYWLGPWSIILIYESSRPFYMVKADISSPNNSYASDS